MPSAAQRAEIEATLYSYLKIRFPHLGNCGADTRLLDGAVDSLGILELMMSLGDRFGITIEDIDFDPENLETPRRIVQFIERKQS